MASSKEYLFYVLDLLKNVPNISYKKMMGEYLLYQDSILFGGIYDDRFLIKKNGKLSKYHFQEVIPYPGAKPMLLVDIESSAEIEKMFAELKNNVRKDHLITERLILRKPKLSDVEPMFNNWASDLEVTRYMTWPPHQNKETTERIVNYWLSQEEDPKTTRFMITLKNSDEPIGIIDVVDYIEGNPEIGYCLSRKHWNKGYMSEACRAFLDYLFNLGFKKVLIEADIRNIGSNRVIAKCGFKFTHIEEKEHCSKFKPEPVTVNWYEILK